MGKGHIGDFLSFWIDDTHSSDLGLTRVSDGSRYTKTLLPSFKDETAEVPGGDGTYYYGSRYEKKEIPIKVAFDDLSESQFRQITQLIGDKQMHRLVFDEEPYKEYVVKIAAPPEFKYLCFDEVENHEDENGEIERRFYRVYKGEGELKFVCYDGYARNRTGYKWLEDYDLEVFSNKNEWLEASKISPKSFGWKILVGNKDTKYKEGIEIPFNLVEQVSPIEYGVTLNLLQVYQVIIRDGDLIGNAENGTNTEVKPVYHKVLTKPEILYVPNVGERVGILIEEDDRHGQCILFNEGNSIQIWVENSKALPWKDCCISVYRLVSSVRQLNKFDEFISMESTNNNKTTKYYINNYGDIEIPFKIIIYSTYIPHLSLSLNNEKMLELDSFFTKDSTGTTEKGIQINTKTHLIESFDYIGEVTNHIYNDKILVNYGFKNIPVGENVITIDMDNIETGIDFGLHLCFIEYTPRFL